MNKINKTDVIPPGGLTFRNIRRDGSNSTENCVPVVHGEPQINLDTELISHDPSLRWRIETAQRLKRDLSIENQAATTFGIVEGAIGTLIIWGGKKLVDYLIKKGADARLARELGEATGVLGEHWSIDLYGVNEPERCRAVQGLKTAYFENPQEVIDKVKEGLQVLHKLNPSEGNIFNEYQGMIRGFSSALEALYQRDDTQEDIRESCNWFIDLLEGSQRQEYPLIDKFSQESMRRILVNNQKLLPFIDYKIPPFQGQGIARSDGYREAIYKTMLSTLVEPQDECLRQTEYDPLYLRRPFPDDFPNNLKRNAMKLRDALVQAFKEEVRREKRGGSNYAVVGAMREVLTLSDQIDPTEWSKDAQENKAKAEAYERVFSKKFKGWASEVSQMPEDQLRNCFDTLVREYEASPVRKREVDGRGEKSEKPVSLPEGFENWLDVDLDQLRLLFQKDKYLYGGEELNGRFKWIWERLNLGSDNLAERLTHKNYEKGLFFFRYLHALLDKVVSIGEGPPALFRDLLDEENKATILKVCRRVVHDGRSFPGTRNWEFFLAPDSESVPGLALALHHKLTKHIDDESGYVDLYRLRELVLRNVVNSLYPPNNTTPSTRSFLFSGPPGSGKSSFAEALANQLALPLFVLQPGMINVKRHGATVNYKGADINLSSFFLDIVNKNTPCILLIDEADEILPPSTDHDKKEEGKSRSGLFITLLEPRGDKTISPKVISIMTTNLPLTETVDVSSIDENGYSGSIETQLYDHIDPRAIREGRADKKIFTFHRLYNEQQGEVLARRFIEPYISAGKIVGPVDYVKAGREVMGYAPGTIEKVFADTANATTEQVTQEQLLCELKKHPSLIRLYADPQAVIDIEGIIKSLVKGSKTKKLSGPINHQELAIQAKGLNYEQMHHAIMDLTPDTLTQENIIAAFEKVRREG